ALLKSMCGTWPPETLLGDSGAGLTLVCTDCTPCKLLVLDLFPPRLCRTGRFITVGVAAPRPRCRGRRRHREALRSKSMPSSAGCERSTAVAGGRGCPRGRR